MAVKNELDLLQNGLNSKSKNSSSTVGVLKIRS